MATGKVEICGVDTATLPVLTNERMRELFPLVHGGDRQAREEFIRGNLRLVLSVVQRFSGRNENADDLFQVGCIGLIKALDHFDVSQNVRFSTYAVPMIAGEIKRHIRDEGPIKVSRQTKSLAAKIAKYVEEQRLSTGNEPTLDQIAKQFSVEPSEAVYAMDSAVAPVSLYEQYEEDGSYLIDSVQTKDETEEKIDLLTLRECIANLDERDKKIILLRYYRDKTQSEVAAVLGISQVQVSRLEARILKDIRAKMQ